MFGLLKSAEPVGRLNSKGRPFVTGTENTARQRFAYHHPEGSRAVYRRAVLAKRQAQLEAIYGTHPSGSLLARFWQLMIRFVVRMTPTVQRLEREQRAAQEVRHSYSRTKFGNPVVGSSKRRLNQRRSGS